MVVVLDMDHLLPPEREILMSAKIDKPFDWTAFQGGPAGFVSFSEVGDKVTGTISKIEIGEDFNGIDCPQLTIDAQVVTCGQFDLQRKVVAAAPKVGDVITIEFAGYNGRMKAFKVTVDAAGF